MKLSDTLRKYADIILEHDDLTRRDMIQQLEEFWYRMQEKYPNEPMDIPAAVEYYHSLPNEHLAYEYNEKIKGTNYEQR